MPKNTSKGGKSLKSLSPVKQQKPGGDAGPGGNAINSAQLLTASGTKLMAGMSSYRGKGGHI